MIQVIELPRETLAKDNLFADIPCKSRSKSEVVALYREVLRRMDLSHLPWGLKVQVHDTSESYEIIVQVLIEVRPRIQEPAWRERTEAEKRMNWDDAQSDDILTITFSRYAHYQPLITASEVAEKIRYFIREAVLHEIDENILVEGVRVYDPHKKEPYENSRTHRET